MKQREIKFRAWDPSTGKMFTPAVVTGEGSVFETGLDYENGIDANDCPLMQYTGLKDKNGKEIYEGDVSDFWDTETYKGLNGDDNKRDVLKRAVWEWHENNACFRLTVSANRKIRPEDCEVIGDIYRNPELLNQ